MKFLTNTAQQKLANYYRLLLSDPAHLVSNAGHLRAQRKEVEKIEDVWNKYEESLLDLSSISLNKNNFLSWYLSMEEKMNHDIAHFLHFLKYQASPEQVAYYICMEELIDGSFDDLMAMVQVGMPPKPKMCAADNYWDEMGNGNFDLMHTAMFKTSSNYMRQLLTNQSLHHFIQPAGSCLMNGNLLLMWAVRREYNMRLIGAMGLVEGSAPKRFAATTYCLERNKFPQEVIAYHRAHISIDTNHSKQWFADVLEYYTDISTSVIRELVIGVLVRHRIALNYYDFLLSQMNSIHTCKKAS